MKYFVADKNQVVLGTESGTTWGTLHTSGTWIGMVQNHTISDNEGITTYRYAGTADRNVSTFIQGPTEVTGTLEFFPQDFRFAYYALGSCAGNGSPVAHTIVEVNSDFVDPFNSGTFPSFQLQDAQVTTTGSNLVRTCAGVMVDSATWTLTEGEPMRCSVNYVAKTCSFATGGTWTATESAVEPYTWKQSIVHLPSGTEVDSVKDMSITVNNNLEVPHYCGSERNIGMPIPTNREYEISMTMNTTVPWQNNFIATYYKGGSAFNMMLWCPLSSTTNRTMSWAFSGCYVTAVDAPSPSEGVNEMSVTIVPTTSSITEKANTGSYFSF